MHVKLKHPGAPITSPLLPQATAASPHATVSATTTPTPCGGSLAQPSSNPTPVPPTRKQHLEPAKPSQPSQASIAPRYSDIPLLVVSIGAWQKRSLFCGDTMARFSYEERKFVWEIYNLNSLFARMEIPFDNVSAIGYELVQENIVKLFIDVSSPPLFFEGVIQAHKPTTWIPIDTDITGGEALPNTRHILHLLKLSIKQPLEQLLQVEPRFQQMLKAYSPFPKAPPKHNSFGMTSLPVGPPPSSVHIVTPYTISPKSLQSIAIPMYNDCSSVPPLVADTDESPHHFSLCSGSDDEEETPSCAERQPSFLDGLRRCQCFGGCSSSDCLCFKSLEACSGCDCDSCANPLNATIDLASSTSSSPPSPIVFFPATFSPLSPPLSPALSV